MHRVATAAAAEKEGFFGYDRIEAISLFLRTAYPELAESEGLIELESDDSCTE